MNFLFFVLVNKEDVLEMLKLLHSVATVQVCDATKV